MAYQNEDRRWCLDFGHGKDRRQAVPSSQDPSRVPGRMQSLNGLMQAADGGTKLPFRHDMLLGLRGNGMKHDRRVHNNAKG